MLLKIGVRTGESSGITKTASAMRDTPITIEFTFADMVDRCDAMACCCLSISDSRNSVRLAFSTPAALEKGAGTLDGTLLSCVVIVFQS